MRRVIMWCMFLSMVASALPGGAQTLAEWFGQSSTRLEYYAQQIGALGVYLGELQQRYQITAGGLGTIGDSKQGEFDLHNSYYASLGEINPALGQLGEIAEIAALQAAIVQRFTEALRRYRRDGLLPADGLAYVTQVYGNVLQAGLADVEILTEILTTGWWQMTDDQRMGRIRTLDSAIRERYQFTLAFTDGTDVLERQEADEAAGLGTIKALYGLP